jgi:molybdate transport system substrate-binding protein
MARAPLRLWSVLIAVMAAARIASAGEVRLSVAASLTDVGNALVESYEKAHPGVTVRKNYGGSGVLARQIENGAAADVFISANLQWMEYLKGRNLVDRGSIGSFAYNVLVVAGAADPGISTMPDLLRLEKIAIGSPGSVPAGAYAMEALRAAGIDGQLRKKFVMARDVRECLMYAERGEVDAAFVYRTDALLARRATILFVVPQELYPRVTYPMALTAAGAKNPDAAEFFRYLGSEAARSVLARFGFSAK